MPRSRQSSFNGEFFRRTRYTDPAILGVWHDSKRVFSFQTSFWTGMTFEINNPSERIISFKQFPALHVVVISVDFEHRHALSWVSRQHTGDKSAPPCHCKEPRMPWSYKKQKQVDSGSLLRIWGPLTAYLIATYGNSTFLGQAKRGPWSMNWLDWHLQDRPFQTWTRPACGALHAPVLCIRKKCIHSSMSSLAKQSRWQPRLHMTISYQRKFGWETSALRTFKNAKNSVKSQFSKVTVQ